MKTMRTFFKTVMAFTLAVTLSLSFAQVTLASPKKHNFGAKNYDSSDYDDDDYNDHMYADPHIRYVRQQGDQFKLDYGTWFGTKVTATLTSSDTSALTVDSDGNVEILADITGYSEHQKIGTITVKAQPVAGKKFEDATCDVYKGIPVESVTVSPNIPKSIKAGEEFLLTDYISVTPANASLPLYQIDEAYDDSNKDDDYSVEFDYDGYVRGLSPGKLSLLVYTPEGVHTTVNITVTGTAVKKLTLKEKKATVNVGDSYTLAPNLSPTDASNKRFYYRFLGVDHKDNPIFDGVSVKNKQTPSAVKPNKWYGMNKAEFTAFLSNISNDGFLALFSWSDMFDLLLASGMPEEDIYDIDELEDYFKTADLKKLAAKIDFSKLLSGYEGYDIYSNSPTNGDKGFGIDYSDGPLTIQAKKAGVYFFVLYSESGDHEAEFVLQVKNPTSTKIEPAATGDNTPLYLLVGLLGLSAAAIGFIAVKKFKKRKTD